MAQVNFQYITFIKCQEEEKISDICNNFLMKSNLIGKNMKYFYSGNGKKEFDQNLTFNEMAIPIDKKRKKMTFIVTQDNNNNSNNIITNGNNNNNNNEKSSKKISRYIICPTCGLPAIMKFDGYNINLYKCKINHINKNIPLKNFEETQIIKNDLTKSDYDLINISITDEKYPLLCETDKEPILYICKKCNKYLCYKCEHFHKEKNYEKKIPLIEEEVALKKLIKIKEKINLFNRSMKKMFEILNHVKDNIDNYYKLNENIINNYKLNQKLNSETVLNIHELINNNEIIQDIDEVNNSFRLEDIFSKILKIYRKSSNEIRLRLMIEKSEVNKEIFFLDNMNIEEHLHDNLKELDEKNVDFYINNVKYKYKKYFIPEEEGNYEIILKFKFFLKNCSYMFFDCKNINKIDLSGFDTKNITNMESMFDQCSNLIDIDFSFFNTENVLNMKNMFLLCSNLKQIDLFYFNTKNLKKMENMFSECKNLISLDLSSFNTEKVSDMSGMFFFCTNLISLDLSSFNTENVVDMHDMFNGCENLTKINLSSFKTQQVKNMSNMFSLCRNLNCLDISSFNFIRVKNFSSMFSGCDELKEIKIKKKAEDIIRKNVFIAYGLTKLTIV